MSVIEVVPVEITNHLGYEDAALPSGVWFSTGTVTGDGSGGTATVQHEFKGAGQRPNNLFYSLEQVFAFTTEGVARDFNIQSQAFDGTWKTGIAVIGTLFLAAGGTSMLDIVDSKAFKGIILGELTRQIGTAAVLSAQAVNPGVAKVLGSSLHGYFWGPEAKSARGGPQRPTSGLFSQ